MHTSTLYGCTKKTKTKILQRIYWFNLEVDVKVFFRQCDICGRDKKPSRTPRASMGSVRTGAPWDVVATDYLGQFPITRRGNHNILILTDYFSKFVEVIPVTDMSAKTCTLKVLNEFISRWGCPLSILSDQGRTYESNVFEELCRVLEIKKLPTNVQNPRFNGQIERFNRTLLRMIRAYLAGEQENWDLNLGLAGTNRATPNESTKLTPNLLTIGREVRLPAEVLFGSATNSGSVPVTNYGEYVNSLRSKLNHAHTVARHHLKRSAERRKIIYDRKMVLNNYEVGDIAWCLTEARKVGEATKLQPAYEGPCVITSKLSPMTFTVRVNSKGLERIIHHNKLKPYEATVIPNWVMKLKNSFNQSQVIRKLHL